MYHCATIRLDCHRKDKTFQKPSCKSRRRSSELPWWSKICRYLGHRNLHHRKGNLSHGLCLHKANSLINSMLDDNTIVELGALVLDEMHMVGDPHRGYIMELLVTKVLAIQLPIQVQRSQSALTSRL